MSIFDRARRYLTFISRITTSAGDNVLKSTPISPNIDGKNYNLLKTTTGSYQTALKLYEFDASKISSSIFLHQFISGSYTVFWFVNVDTGETSVSMKNKILNAKEFPPLDINKKTVLIRLTIAVTNVIISSNPFQNSTDSNTIITYMTFNSGGVSITTENLDDAWIFTFGTDNFSRYDGSNMYTLHKVGGSGGISNQQIYLATSITDINTFRANPAGDCGTRCQVHKICFHNRITSSFSCEDETKRIVGRRSYLAYVDKADPTTAQAASISEHQSGNSFLFGQPPIKFYEPVQNVGNYTIYWFINLTPEMTLSTILTYVAENAQFPPLYENKDTVCLFVKINTIPISDNALQNLHRPGSSTEFHVMSFGKNSLDLQGNDIKNAYVFRLTKIGVSEYVATKVSGTGESKKNILLAETTDEIFNFHSKFCTDSGSCNSDEKCHSSQCVDADLCFDCKTIEMCDKGNCIPIPSGDTGPGDTGPGDTGPGDTGPPSTCTTNDDCKSGEICTDGSCVKKSLLKTWWFWAIIGVGVVILALIIFFVVRSRKKRKV